MIRIVIADDHPMVRAGLEQLLQSFPDLEVVGVAADGLDAVRLVQALVPDVVLMDLAMPVMDGIQAISAIKASHPKVNVIALTTFQDPGQVGAALGAGASGYLVKDVEAEVLVAGIRASVRGGAPLSPSVAATLLQEGGTMQRPSSLSMTPRESQILRLIAQGDTNGEIGRRLGISEKTVKAHCSSLFRRLGVTDRTQAAIWATRNLPTTSDG
jgi:DNA-binding NarL/FixJ family response regulator